MTVTLTHGHIVFDASTPTEFIILVQETLETSDHIQTEFFEMDEYPDDVLLVQEVDHD